MNKILIPKIRFPQFSGEWINGNLSDLLEESKARNYDEKYSKAQVLSVSGAFGVVNQIKHLGRSYAGNIISHYGILEKNDIVYTKSPLKANPFGIIKVNKFENGIVSPLYAVFKLKNNNLGEFIEYYFQIDINLNNFLRPLIQKGAKNDMQISNSRLLSGNFNYPKPEEQQKISVFLCVIDKKLENLKAKKEKLEKYKKGVMQKIFSQKIRFKDENGADFEDWKEKVLGDIGTSYNGLSGKSGDDFGKGEKYITYKQIFNKSKININKCEFVNIFEGEKQNKANYGDIFFTVSSETPNEIGFASILLDFVDNLYLNSFCFGYRPNSLKEIEPNYARFFFRSYIYRKEVIKLAQGSTRYNLSKTNFMKLKFLFPSCDEQIKIADFLSKIDDKIEKETKKIEKTEEFKKGLLQHMFI